MESDPTAGEQLLPLVYDELRRLAAQRLAHEQPGQTLQPTSLVHEAYLRLVDGHPEQHWNGRGHFFGAAAEAMRRILVENARRKARQKRGGDRVRLEVDVDETEATRTDALVLAVHDSLEALAAQNAQAAELVKLRFFAGLTLAEAADVQGISPRTADRLWAYARAWLHDALQS